MRNIYKYIIDSTISGKVDKQVGAMILKMLKSEDMKQTDDVAIIGLSIRLPNSTSIEEYWDNIKNGVDCIKDFPEARKKDADRYLNFSEDVEERPFKYAEGGYIEDIDMFDYKVFRISPKEASLMDPYQRIFLETAWESIEDAGYGGKKLAGSNTGVFVGYASNAKDCYQKIVYDVDPALMPVAAVGNITALLPTRIAYLLDLKGPSMIIDTACSSSLVAVHLACNALENGDCDVAIAGGIKMNLFPLDKDYMKTGIEASDGRTRAFDDASDGAGAGEGVVSIVLKPLSKAKKDRDNIYAVIKGSAINQDGESMGITAPNPDSQTEVIIKAWEKAGINPLNLSYIEAHGTGTRLGDPIEIQGLEKAFRKYTDKNQVCPIGSMKTNMGHLFECAGLAGLVKVIMMLKNKEIPPNINFNKPNVNINFQQSPIYVNTRLRKFKSEGIPMNCGISSFGLSGTNCHMVIEEAPVLEENNEDGLEANVLVLSAKSQEALYNLVENYHTRLSDNNMKNELGDICYTANTGRGCYNFRLAIISNSLQDLKEKISELRATNLKTSKEWFRFGEHSIIPSNKKTRAMGEITETDKNKLLLEGRALVKEYLEGDKKLIYKICDIFINGGDINWEKFYSVEKYKKTSLPVYPFEKKRCWIDIQETIEEFSNSEIEDNIFYNMKWVQCEEDKEVKALEDKGKAILVFKGKGSLGEEFVESLRSGGYKVFVIEHSSEYTKVEDYKYQVNNDEVSYNRLFEELKGNNIEQIVHMLTLDQKADIANLRELSESEDMGLYNLFYIIRALIKNGISHKVEVLIVTKYVNSITGMEKQINPENAAIVGLGKVVGQEYGNITCRVIDVDDNIVATDLIKEMNLRNNIYQVAYRNGKKYIEEFSEENVEDIKDSIVDIKENGIYIITGGTGGIGVETAKYLSAKNKVKLALINRSAFPLNEQWEDILLKGEDEELCNKITTFKEIETTGSELIFCSVDVTNIEEMRKTLINLREKHGQIKGVIHGAGIPGAGYLIRKDREVFAKVVDPKIKGTWIIDQLTRTDNLDFFVMYSSAVSVTGEAGQGDYVAGNSYMDSYAEYRNRLVGKTLTVNWVTWKSAGMSVKFNINVDGVFKAIHTNKAIEALDKALNKEISKVFIGEVNTNLEFISIFNSLPFKISKKLKQAVDFALNNNDTMGNKNIISNGAYEMAIVENGKVAFLPRGKKVLKKKLSEKSQDVKLKGKEDEVYTEVEKKLAAIYSEVLGVDEVSIYDNFFELGGDSIMLTRMHSQVETSFPGIVALTDLFSYSSVSRLAEFIYKNGEDANLKEVSKIEKHNNLDSEVAIIGIAINLPKASNATELWNNIKNGLDCVGSIPKEREADLKSFMNYTGNENVEDIKFAEGAYLEDIDKFDYKFFRMSPKEASLMDPYQRLFLQNVWQAIEDSGYGDRNIYGSRTGVYVGYASSAKDSYHKMIYDIDPEMMPISMAGNITALMPSRISYLLDLKGPTMVIDTACSSSLVCIHLACQSIRLGECEMAIAGGVRMNLVPVDKENMKMGIETSDGRTRTFDNNADGAGMGEGIVTVLLKPLKKAIEDKDNIYAIIKGSAINQDGASIGLTAPNPKAQEDVIVRAWENAGINPETLSFIEAHGTATKLGDPIEIDALKRAFKRYTNKKQFCAIGTIKTNMGHLHESSGLAGLVKSVQGLRNREIPPSIHFSRPNSTIDFNNSPVYFNNKLRKFKNDSQPMRCGVSAFGLGGTNCHVVLEEYMEIKESEIINSNDIKMLCISAKNKEVLANLLGKYSGFLEENTRYNIEDICYTANSGRMHHTNRLVILTENIKDLKIKLEKLTQLDYEKIAEDWFYYGEHKVIADNRKAISNIEITEAEKTNYGNMIFKTIEKFDGKNQEVLKEICELYTKGADINWREFYKNEKFKKVNIPVYPFEKIRCWLQIPDNTIDIEEELKKKLFFNMGWEIEENTNQKIRELEENVLLLKGSTAISEELILKFKALGINLIVASISGSYKKIDEFNYTISGTENDYEKLISDIKNIKAIKITQIIHMLSINGREKIENLEQLEESQLIGVHSLFYITRAILKNGIKEEIDFVLVSESVNSVVGNETIINPENATLFGLGKVVEQEYSNIVCRGIDIDNTGTAMDIFNEIKIQRNVYQVAIRNGNKYEEIFSEVKISELKDKPVVIKEEGIYIITGGTGGIGLEIAEHISSLKRVKIALISRSGLPERENWEDLINIGVDKKLRNKLLKIKAIESNGSEIILIQADVVNLEDMEKALNLLREKYCKINGIINCAGIAGAGYIVSKNKEIFDNVMNTKVRGNWILDNLTQEDNLDFFIMFSSAVSISGEAGQGDYVAANSYMDSYCAFKQKSGRRFLTINWIQWKEAGMSVEYGINIDTIFKAIPTCQAISSFEEIINKDISRVLIGELNYNLEFISIFAAYPFNLSKELSILINAVQQVGRKHETRVISNNGYEMAIIENGKVKLLPRGKKTIVERSSTAGEVKLVGGEEDSYSEVEYELAKIFNEVLGCIEINIEDSFFELGGDSIMLIRMHELIDRAYPEKTTLTDMFEFPTVYKLSRHIMDAKEVVLEVKTEDVIEETRNIFEELQKGSMSIEDAINGIIKIK